MASSIKSVMRPHRKPAVLRLAHWLLALLGLFNLYLAGRFFFETWAVLRSQGLSGRYLFAAAVVLFPILIILFSTCFAGTFALTHATEKGGLGRWLWVIGATIISVLMPQGALYGYYAVIVMAWPKLQRLF